MVAVHNKENPFYMDMMPQQFFHWSHMLLQAIKASGATYLEAPVSGSKQPAEKGQLIFLCGGDKELYEKATPLLKVMGKAQFFLGEVCATRFSCKPDTDGNKCR